MLLALALLVCTCLWPAWAGQRLPSRLGTVVMAAWCWGFAVVLHPELCAGVALGFRQFRQDCRDLRGYFGRWF